MPGHLRSCWFDRGTITRVWAATLAFALVGSSLAAAQNGRPLELAQAARAPAPGANEEPDMFDRISRWFDRSVSGLNEGLKETFTDRQPPPERQRATSGAAASNGSAPPAAAASVSPLGIDIISQRQKCEPAANGAPDCPRAAEVACQSRGYATGRSLQTQSERICSPPPLFAQQGARKGGCRTEAYVLRAICQ